MLLKNFLKTLPAFGSLSDAEAENLARAMRVQDYPDRHEFVRQGERGMDLFLLIEGEVSVQHYGSSGHVHELKRLKSGELFGMLSLSDRHPASASCIAAGPVKVASLPWSAYELLYQTAAPIGHHFLFAVAYQMARDLRDRANVLRELLRQS